MNNIIIKFCLANIISIDRQRSLRGRCPVPGDHQWSSLMLLGWVIALPPVRVPRFIEALRVVSNFFRDCRLGADCISTMVGLWCRETNRNGSDLSFHLTKLKWEVRSTSTRFTASVSHLFPQFSYALMKIMERMATVTFSRGWRNSGRKKLKGENGKIEKWEWEHVKGSHE